MARETPFDERSNSTAVVQILPKKIKIVDGNRFPKAPWTESTGRLTMKPSTAVAVCEYKREDHDAIANGGHIGVHVRRP